MISYPAKRTISVRIALESGAIYGLPSRISSRGNDAAGDRRLRWPPLLRRSPSRRLAYPESLAASSDGTLFIGSAKMGGVLRVTPGSSTPTPWIAPTTFGTRSIFGVLVDERSGTLWTCSNDLASDGIASPGSGAGSALKGFDLKTGAGKVSAPFPGNHPLCNDIAVAKDGRVYVSDEYGARVLRLSYGLAHARGLRQRSAIGRYRRHCLRRRRQLVCKHVPRQRALPYRRPTFNSRQGRETQHLAPDHSS